MTTEEYFGKWLTVIEENKLDSIVDTMNKLYSTCKVMPAYNDVFKAFHLCPYDALKIVFLGQDPYPQEGVATGILFGNKQNTKSLSPSLEVIKDACIDYTVSHGPIWFDVTLESWAEQGILMLNSALTVLLNSPTSHTMLWRPFIASLLRNLSIHESGIIYVLFGKQAQTFRPYIKEQFNHVFEVNHPAYYARLNAPMPVELFKEINTLVKGKYGKPIEWYKNL